MFRAPLSFLFLITQAKNTDCIASACNCYIVEQAYGYTVWIVNVSSSAGNIKRFTNKILFKIIMLKKILIYKKNTKALLFGSVIFSSINEHLICYW